MKSQVLGLRVASAITGLVGLAHLLRILTSVQVVIGSWYVQRRWSAVAVVVAAALCVWFWRLSTAAEPARTNPPAA